MESINKGEPTQEEQQQLVPVINFSSAPKEKLNYGQFVRERVR